MTNYQKSIALDLLGRTREGIKILIDALGDEFFNEHTEVKYEYSLINKDPKQLYRLLFGEDIYTDMVTSAQLNELEDNFLQVAFTIKYGDKVHHVWGRLNRVRTINKKDVDQFPEVINVTERVVLK